MYDESVPRGRLYGRYLTHFLGLCRDPEPCRRRLDVRLPPLSARPRPCALLDRVQLPTRMDFDIEILVRLVWDGLRCKNVATRVIYPPGGVSHFDMLRDNVRISATHARLTCGMLLRLPRFLWRRLAGEEAAAGHWSRLAERGGALGPAHRLRLLPPARGALRTLRALSGGRPTSS